MSISWIECYFNLLYYFIMKKAIWTLFIALLFASNVIAADLSDCDPSMISYSQEIRYGSARTTYDSITSAGVWWIAPPSVSSDGGWHDGESWLNGGDFGIKNSDGSTKLYFVPSGIPYYTSTFHANQKVSQGVIKYHITMRQWNPDTFQWVANVQSHTQCLVFPITYCGDGQVNGGEQCDGQSWVGANQSCTNQCTLVNNPYCGDGVKNNNEQCDGQSWVGANQSCTNQCTLVNNPVSCQYTWWEWSACNGSTQTRNPIISVYPANGGQACPNPETRSCTNPPVCGDGTRNGTEQCDYTDSTRSGWGRDGCNNSCQPINNPRYKCSNYACIQDDGNGTYTTSNCNNSCGTAPYCGDGARNNNEQCDYADSSRSGWGNSGCSQQCQPINNPVCQDANAENNGQVWACIYKYACNNNYQCVQQKWGVYGSNNCDNRCVAPATADVQITKSVDRATFPNTVGERITWTLTYRNNGPSAAENVAVVDILPESLRAVVSMSMTAGKIEAGGKYTWYLWTLQPGQGGTITITSSYEWGKADNTPLTNVVSIATTTAWDNPNNNNGSATTKPYSNPVGSLGDRVWIDANKNGIQDAGEQSLSGVVVALYACNGTMPINTTVTDVNGNYLFTNLAAGSYKVKFTLPNGYSWTQKGTGTATDSDANPDGSTDCIVLGVGENRRDVDAWVIIPTSNPQADVTITKSVDRASFPNNTGELITWTLNYKNNGPSAAQNIIITDTLPVWLRYISSSLALPMSCVQMPTCNVPVWTSWTPDSCLPIVTCSPLRWELGTLASWQTGSITITTKYLGWVANGSGIINTTVISTNTAGDDPNNNTWSAITTPYSSGTASLGNYVWIDADKDGVQDTNEVSLSGVKVDLYKINSCAADLTTPIATTTTNGSGFYLFTGLSAGNYKVKFTLSNGYEFTLPNQGSDDALDSDAGLNGVTNCIELKEGEVNMTVDAGVYLEQPVSCEWLTLSTTSITVGSAVSYNCLHKNATSAVVTVTLSGSTTGVVNMTWFTGQFTINTAGTYNVQCTLDNGITYKVVSYAATGTAINCAYKAQANNTNMCAVKLSLDPYLTSGVNLSGLIYMPTPYPYCSDAQMADTTYACVAAPAGVQILTRVDNMCRAQLTVSNGWGGGWGCRSCGGGGSPYCGNNKVESGEECDGNDTSTKICTNQCKYKPKWSNPSSPHNPTKPKLNLPSCESIDPPSVNKWEYLPFWWELESDSNVNFVSNCNQAVNGKTNVLRWWSDKFDDPLCHFTMHVDDTRSPQKAAEFSKYCYQDAELRSEPLFEDFFSTRPVSLQWYERSKNDWWSAFFWPSNWSEVPNKYGEYKLSLDGSTFYVCEQVTKSDGSKEWKQSTQRYEAKNAGWYSNECSFNFTVTTPYFVQQGKSLGTVQISQWVLNNFFSFDTRGSIIDNILQISQYQRTNNLAYLGQQFADKYTRLAGSYNANFRKVAGKEIYVKVGNANLTIAGGDLPRGTIISNGGDITIQGDLRGKVMMIANGGTIYFESMNKDAVQQIEGIYIADNVKSLNQVFNKDLSKWWASKWWIRIKWIVISKDASDIEQIYGSRRSYLENWFKTDSNGSNYKRDAILNGAALTIETDPSFWTSLPPGANELMTALEAYR
jgi:uncharacterized repeat protein (TIGR01451 family)